jgi:two-component system, NtrC family, response regulator HydG
MLNCKDGEQWTPVKANELDLDKVLSFGKQSGSIYFMGHRALLIDARALGLLRKELISAVGPSVARTMLTRAGYAHGWLTADDLSREYPELIRDPACGPTLHSLQGMVTTRDFRPKGKNAPVTWIWEDSYEAEQHLIHSGVSAEPVCWTLTAFASGYISRFAGSEYYCIEHKCRGKGDALCHVEARTREGWGDQADEYLPFFKKETVEEVLQDLTARLRKSERRLSRLKRLFNTPVHPSGLVTNNQVLRQQLDLARRAAKVDSSVLIIGESGVGKEMLARFIHDESTRAGRPFVAVNCAAVAETLLESEFFGHSKGAFTGADSDRVGLFEAASGGTILLDEIGEMSPGMQTKLLRVLQEREVRRVGENRPRPVDVKVIATTNRDLEDEVKKGRFRQDLYYRLCVIELVVPPLRNRVEDILPLARFFLEEIAGSTKRPIDGFSPAAAEQLLLYTWPGNVRELRNVVERAVALCWGPTIQAGDLPRTLRGDNGNPKGSEIRPLSQIERNYILAALEITKGNKALAAKKLNIGLASLYRKLKEYKLQ